MTYLLFKTKQQKQCLVYLVMFVPMYQKVLSLQKHWLEEYIAMESIPLQCLLNISSAKLSTLLSTESMGTL